MPKIYTKTGDNGTSSLYDGTILPKTNIYFEALGNLDEASSYMGLLTSLISDKDIVDVLRRIQLYIIDMSSDIATPNKQNKFITQNDVTFLEKEIDELVNRIPPLNEFLITGVSQADSYCNICRSVVRRAERSMWNLYLDENNLFYKSDSFGIIMKFVNRLSDYFFCLARLVAPTEIRVSDLRERISST